MMQGDQYRQPIEIQGADGTPIKQSDVLQLEISFSCGVKKLLTDGGVYYDDKKSTWYISLTQRDTFLMRGKQTVSARVKFNSGDVLGAKIETDRVEESISKVVL